MIMQKLMYLPADLPKINKDEILENFKPGSNFYVWDFEKLTVDSGGKYGKNDFTDDAKNKYPNLIDYLGSLPFTAISNVKINMQTDQKPEMHIDFRTPEDGNELVENINDQEPCGYRFVVKGGRDKLLIRSGEEEKVAYLPEDTDCYLLNQSEGYHAVQEDYGRIIVYVTAFIDHEKHQDLLKRSLTKYGDYAIYE